MNPNYEQTNIRLPKPLPPSIDEHPPATLGTPEQDPMTSPETSFGAQQVPNMMPAQMPAMPVQGMPAQAMPMQPQPMAVAAPPVAEDADLIEKEWVEKAKEIVANTRNDPYSQSQEITQLKADYIKKRYNKDIRLTET